MNRNLAGIFGVTLLLLGMAAESLGQVPQHPDRIRDTTKEILARPEFRSFPRLKPGQPASGLSGMRPEKGIPRLKSSRGLPAELGGEADQGQGRGRQSNNNVPRQRGPQGLPANAPDGDRPGGNRPGKIDDALGREDVFPEAGNLDGLLENNPFKTNPQGRGPANDGNDAGPLANNAQENGNPPNNVAHPAVPPPEANPANGRNNNPDGDNPARQGGQDALPAPRPRQHRDDDAAITFPEPPVGELARFVGAMFHFLAWGILAVICGLIMWLIIKAIREYERPHAYAKANFGGQDLLDLEPAQAPGELPADVYLGQAQKLADQGRYREAVVQLVLGAMSRVERAGWVRFRRGLTVRDYLRGIHQFPAAHQGFRAIIRVFEPLAFGRREPTLAHFEQSLQGYETGFGLD